MADSPITYRDAGVDIDEMNSAVLKMREHVRSTYDSGVLTDIGSFGGIYAPPWREYADPVLVSSIDGVGTKVKVAAAANRFDTIGIDLVSHCANDILVQGARPLLFLDYYATSKLSAENAADVVKGLAEGCRNAGCVLIGGETAEMPGVYAEGEYDLAGCIVGILDRNRIVDGTGVQPGDAVIGLGSTGLHTNGYSLARRILFDVAGLSINDRPDELCGQTVSDALLATHKCYVASVLSLLATGVVKGMAHLTGGGFYDNIPRSLPMDCSVTVERQSWTVPPIFTMIQRLGSVPDHEMFRTFNMGIGYTLIVRQADEGGVIDRLKSAGEAAYLIGEVTRGGHEVTVL
jgi:phosphoribosylformylglycinamidine cyclo-ligase